LVLGDMGRVDEAIQEYTFLIDNTSSTWKGRAFINRAFLQSDPDARIKDLNAAIQYEPEDGYFFLGIEYMDRKDYKTAIENFEKAVEYGPETYSNYQYLGLNQLHAGEYEAAKETYQRIIPHLESAENRDQVIQELRDETANSPAMQPTADEIIKSLLAAKLP